MLKLFALPFAGGNRYSFNGMKKHLPADVEYIPMELPGRASRMNEPLLSDIGSMVDDMYERVRPSMAQGYALFGHCIGALLAFLLSRKSVQEGDECPACLIVSGCRAPSQLNGRPMDLSAAGLRKRMTELGISAELLDHEDFYDMIAPVMKADLMAFNNYRYEKMSPACIPIRVIMEKDCRYTEAEAMLWQEESALPLQLFHLPGSLNSSQQILAGIVSAPNHSVNR